MSINYDYKMGLKRELVTALRPVFADTFPDENLRNKVYVGLEFPLEQIRYPAIYVTYSEQEIRNVGVGSLEWDEDEDGNAYQYKRFRFTGAFNFRIMALSPEERDRLAAAMVNILGMASDISEFRSFYDELHDNDYVQLAFITDRILSGGDNTAPVPWGNEDEQIYDTVYSIAVTGEFTSNSDTGELIQISRVDVYPRTATTDVALPPLPPQENFLSILDPAPDSTITGTFQLRIQAGHQAGISNVICDFGGYSVVSSTTPDSNHVYTMTVDTTQIPNGYTVLNVYVYKPGFILIMDQHSVHVWVSNLPAPTSPLPPAGYNLVFEDNFDTYDLDIHYDPVANADAHIVNTKWHDHIWYAPYAPAGSQYVQDSVLHLVSKRSQNFPQVTMATYHPGIAPKTAFQYGYFECRMRWSGGRGAWPAFWLFAASDANNTNYPDPPPGWPAETSQTAEIDIIEIQGVDPDIFWGTLHMNTNGRWGVPDQTRPPTNLFKLPASSADAFHLYGCLWTANTLNWYYDHKLINSVTPFNSTNQPMMMILQMDTGGWFANNNSIVPTTPDELHAEFDWVRVWQQ